MTQTPFVFKQRLKHNTYKQLEMPPTRRNISRFFKGLEAQCVLFHLGLEVREQVVAVREAPVMLKVVRQTQAAVQAVHLEAPLQGA